MRRPLIGRAVLIKLVMAIEDSRAWPRVRKEVRIGRISDSEVAAAGFADLLLILWSGFLVLIWADWFFDGVDSSLIRYWSNCA